MYVSTPFVAAPAAYYYVPPIIPPQMRRPRSDDSYKDEQADSNKRQRRSISPPVVSATSPSPPLCPTLPDTAAAAAAAALVGRSTAAAAPRPPCFVMLVGGSCDTVGCSFAHHQYGAALLASMSHQAPSRLPELHDGLTAHFRPVMFEEVAVSPFHAAAATSPSDRRSTAVLPLPLTRSLLHIYRSAGFMSELLSFSRLTASDVRLVLPVDEARVSSTDELYGFIILAGSHECVQLGIRAVVSAVEGASHKALPLPPSPPSPPPSAPSASSSARASSSSPSRSVPSPLPAPPPRSRSPPRPAAPAPPCPWPLRRNKKCFRNKCPLPAESHDVYSAQLMRCLDTTTRSSCAVPAFTSDFVFVLCRSPSGDSSTFLCSLCVPNDGYASGYVRGRDGSTRTVLEQAAGTRLTWGHPSLADLLMLWKTVGAVGTLEQVDTVVEGITYLFEARPDASVEQLAEHLERFKQQRATQAADRPVLWSMLSRGLQSTRLDSLLAGDAPQSQPQSQPQPQPRWPPQPPAPAQDRRSDQPEDARAGRRRSSGSSERREERSEPCPNSMSGFGCRDSHCRLSHSDRPYASWLAERLRCSSDTMAKMRILESSFKAVLSDNSGLPAQPLVISLPVPGIVVQHRYLGPSRELMRELQQHGNLFISMPRCDDHQASAMWGMLRTRASTRQADTLIESCCWLMDAWREAAYGQKFSNERQVEQAARLGRHLDDWLERRAEYVTAHGEALYAFISRGLGEQVRLSFTLPKEKLVAAPRCNVAMTDTTSEANEPSSNSSASSAASTPSSASSSSDSSCSSSCRGSSASISSGSSNLSFAATSTPASDDTTSPRAYSSPSRSSLPIDPSQLLHNMHATGTRLAYTSFVQHPPYSATHQPFIRILPDQAFANWPVRAGLRDEFVLTLDEEAMPLSAFEERWVVEVFMPPAEAEHGEGKEWCNVCVRMMKGSGGEKEESGGSGGGVKAAMECVMLAVMKRAERVEQLTSASAR